MKGSLKTNKPTLAVEVVDKIFFTAEEEKKFMQAFVDACSLASGVASQIKHDCFRDLMVKHFKINLRKELSTIIDPMVEAWKNTSGVDMSWINRLEEVKFAAYMYVSKDASEGAFDPEKLGPYKSSVITINLEEEEFEFNKKSFREAALKLNYTPDVIETEFDNIVKETSYMEFKYKLNS